MTRVSMEAISLLSAVAIGVAAAVAPLPHLVLAVMCANDVTAAITVPASDARTYHPPIVPIRGPAVLLGTLGLVLIPVTAVRGLGSLTPADLPLFVSFAFGVVAVGRRTPSTLPRTAWIGIGLITVSALREALAHSDQVAANLGSALLIVAPMVAVPSVAVWTAADAHRRNVVSATLVAAAATSTLMAIAEAPNSSISRHPSEQSPSTDGYQSSAPTRGILGWPRR